MQGKDKWEYISQTNFDYHWSSLLKVVGAKKRRVYWEQEEEPRQEEMIVNAILLVEEEQQQQTNYNHKQGYHKGISNPRGESQ